MGFLCAKLGLSSVQRKLVLFTLWGKYGIQQLGDICESKLIFIINHLFKSYCCGITKSIFNILLVFVICYLRLVGVSSDPDNKQGAKIY